MEDIVCPYCHHGVQSFFSEEYGEEVMQCYTCQGTGKAPVDEQGRIISHHTKYDTINPEKFAEENADAIWERANKRGNI